MKMASMSMDRDGGDHLTRSALFMLSARGRERISKMTESRAGLRHREVTRTVSRPSCGCALPPALDEGFARAPCQTFICHENIQHAPSGRSHTLRFVETADRSSLFAPAGSVGSAVWLTGGHRSGVSCADHCDPRIAVVEQTPTAMRGSRGSALQAELTKPRQVNDEQRFRIALAGALAIAGTTGSVPGPAQAAPTPPDCGGVAHSHPLGVAAAAATPAIIEAVFRARCPRAVPAH
jgi:hypothetical protein